MFRVVLGPILGVAWGSAKLCSDLTNLSAAGARAKS